MKIGLDGHPQKNSTKMTSEICITKRSMDIAHENQQNGGFTRSGAHLTMKMGWFADLDQPFP
ncbi:hypothetical protein H5410_056562 [Solanum commersonii]|uniref:Uncharacterized protein n=1 Tax=Solanum commersonii TaxID=4109 RepID=A0A9J5WML7_SOLCO|nr:hypothetical protein H5410_056562 [Solanum commersonii]